MESQSQVKAESYREIAISKLRDIDGKGSSNSLMIDATSIILVVLHGAGYEDVCREYVAAVARINSQNKE